MDFEERLDPELRPILRAFPPPREGVTVPEMRQGLEVMAAAWRATAPRRPQIAIRDESIPGPAEAPPVTVRIYQPQSAPRPVPALLWIHGGGFRVGRYDMDDAQCEKAADELGCMVVSVEYRLAPEHPAPAATEDAYAALLWLAAHSDDLGVDLERIAVGGASAGGGIAASVALMARDLGGPKLKFQLLIYPCVDDSHTTASSHAVTDYRVWNRETSMAAWKEYLGADCTGPASPYAAPARALDLGGLPPAFVLAAGEDLLRDEDIAYAQRLMQAGVATELHVYPGAFHGFYNFAPEAAVSRRAIADFNDALRRGLAA